MSKHRIFVTGGNGFVGSHVVRQLIKHPSESIITPFGLRDHLTE